MSLREIQWLVLMLCFTCCVLFQVIVIDGSTSDPLWEQEISWHEHEKETEALSLLTTDGKSVFLFWGEDVVLGNSSVSSGFNVDLWIIWLRLVLYLLRTLLLCSCFRHSTWHLVNQTFYGSDIFICSVLPTQELFWISSMLLQVLWLLLVRFEA